MPKYMDLRSFTEEGWLQECNRLFFHPRGLSLEVTVTTHKKGPDTYEISGVQDYRNDPEGIRFADGIATKQKRDKVEFEYRNQYQKRIKHFSYAIQPVDDDG